MHALVLAEMSLAQSWAVLIGAGLLVIFHVALWVVLVRFLRARRRRMYYDSIYVEGHGVQYTKPDPRGGR